MRRASARPAPFVGVLVVAAGLAGCQKNEFIAPPPPTVTVAKPARESTRTFTDITGRTDAVESVEIRARVKGFLQTIDFHPSTIVDQGQQLFSIEPDTFEAEVGLREGLVAQAQAEASLAEATLMKATRAAEKGAVTELELMEITARRDGASAAVKSAKAELDKARLELSYTTILAPVRGRVSRELVTVGNLVGSGESTLLTTIVVDDDMFAYFDVGERFLLEAIRTYGRTMDSSEKDGSRQIEVFLQLTDGENYDHAGIINFADNRIDAATGTIRVRAIFPNPDGLLVPGMFVRVRFPHEVADAILVPELALQRDIVGHFCLVVDTAGVVDRRDVELGTLVGQQRIITSGLDGSEDVIVRGLQRARPGITVKTEQAAAVTLPGSSPGSSPEAEGA